jgi:ornithine carbamoyltransferase
MSFDIAVKQLGGSSIILNPDGIHYGKGEETLKDTAKVLTEYVDIVMLRTSSHKNLEEFGKYLDIPIINGLSDIGHPCQIMSDILTYEESNGSIVDKTVTWLGDGNNNMSNSLIEAAGKFNFKLRIACPKKYSPNKMILSWAKKNKVSLMITSRPDEAVKGSDCIMTDKWVSMNDKVNKKAKKKILKPFQVNRKLMSKANSDAIFMHCLPVGRGEEVADEVIDGKQSVVWRQALNRVHAQKSIIKWCLD